MVLHRPRMLDVDVVAGVLIRPVLRPNRGRGGGRGGGGGASDRGPGGRRGGGRGVVWERDVHEHVDGWHRGPRPSSEGPRRSRSRAPTPDRSGRRGGSGSRSGGRPIGSRRPRTPERRVLRAVSPDRSVAEEPRHYLESRLDVETGGVLLGPLTTWCACLQCSHANGARLDSVPVMELREERSFHRAGKKSARMECDSDKRLTLVQCINCARCRLYYTEHTYEERWFDRRLFVRNRQKTRFYCPQCWETVEWDMDE